MATDWGAWSQGRLFPSKACQKKWFFLLPVTWGSLVPSGAQVFAVVFFLSDFYWSLEGWGGSWVLGSGGVSRFMFLCVFFGPQGPWREWNFLCNAAGRRKISLIWGCWRADGSTEIQKETISEFLLNDAARKGDVLWALWPQWPILTSPSLPVLSSWLSPLWPTSQPEEPCPIPHTQVQLLQADGQSDTPVSLAGLSIFRGHSRNNVHFNNSVADTD